MCKKSTKGDRLAMDKKLFALGAAAMMAAGGVSPVLAEESAQDSAKDTTLEYTVDESYEWAIHPSIDFGANAGVNQHVAEANNKVEVTKNVLREGKKLHITVRGSGTDGAFSIDNGGSEVLSYAINDGDADLEVDGTVLDVESGTNTGSKDLTFTLATTSKTAEVAGEYNGTVTYSAAVVAK